MESLESGKPIADCETIDIPESIHTIKWHAEAIDKIYDQTAPAGDDAYLDDRARAGGRGRCRAAVELPAADAGVEDWPGAGGG